MKLFFVSAAALLAIASPVLARPHQLQIDAASQHCNRLIRQGRVINSQRAFNACVEHNVRQMGGRGTSQFYSGFCKGLRRTAKPETIPMLRMSGYGACFK